MNSLNSVLLEGNLVRDPESTTTPRGSVVTNFSVASNRFFKQDDQVEKETSYFQVEAWGKLAQSCFEILKKGRGVRVVGRLKQDRWIGADGKQNARVKIVAEHVEFKPIKNESVDCGFPASDPAVNIETEETVES